MHVMLGLRNAPCCASTQLSRISMVDNRTIHTLEYAGTRRFNVTLDLIPSASTISGPFRDGEGGYPQAIWQFQVRMAEAFCGQPTNRRVERNYELRLATVKPLPVRAESRDVGSDPRLACAIRMLKTGPPGNCDYRLSSPASSMRLLG